VGSRARSGKDPKGFICEPEVKPDLSCLGPIVNLNRLQVKGSKPRSHSVSFYLNNLFKYLDLVSDLIVLSTAIEK